MTNKSDNDATAVAALQLAASIAPLLSGKGPELQSAALADLVAALFAGHHPALRAIAIEDWIACMRSLIPVNEAMMFELHGGKPEGWDLKA